MVVWQSGRHHQRLSLYTLLYSDRIWTECVQLCITLVVSQLTDWLTDCQSVSRMFHSGVCTSDWYWCWCCCCVHRSRCRLLSPTVYSIARLRSVCVCVVSAVQTFKFDDCSLEYHLLLLLLSLSLSLSPCTATAYGIIAKKDCPIRLMIIMMMMMIFQGKWRTRRRKQSTTNKHKRRMNEPTYENDVLDKMTPNKGMLHTQLLLLCTNHIIGHWLLMHM